MSWDELCDKLANSPKFDECEVRETCSKNGWNCTYSNSGVETEINDGDEDGDTYVLYMTFEIENGKETHNFTFYYGDISRIISDVTY